MREEVWEAQPGPMRWPALLVRLQCHPLSSDTSVPRRYLVQLDGYSASRRFATLLSTNSLVLKQASRWEEVSAQCLSGEGQGGGHSACPPSGAPPGMPSPASSHAAAHRC